MWLYIILSTLALLLLLLFGLVTYARWNFGKLEAQGIPVVGPNDWLLGTAMLSFQKNGGLLDIEHMKKYGTVFGMYEGREQQIFICDPDLIRLITTADADYFNSKRFLEFGDPVMNELPDFQPYAKWKALRGMLSPLFNSAVRMRNQLPAMQAAITDFINDIKTKMVDGETLQKFELNTGIYGLMIDLQARAQYSINIGKENGQRFLKIIRDLMSPPAVSSSWSMCIAPYVYAFPFINKILPNTMINPEPIREFKHIVDQMMEHRRKETRENGHHRDFLDHLIEWKDQLATNPDFKKTNITLDTIYMLGISMFLGGTDQLALIIGSMMYHITGNPEIEKKLEEEVGTFWKKCGGKFDNETVGEMTYMNACILEATRLYPFFFRTERVCTRDWEESSRGIKIKKGNVVQIAIWATNRNPDYFENPEEFLPERFMPGKKEELHPYAYTSFGFGPRNCAGKRFSLDVMGLITANLMREFKFVRREDSKVEFLPAGPFFAAHEPIIFDVKKRFPTSSEE